MVINGTDFTLYIAAAVSAAAISALEYYICLKSKKSSSRQALLFLPFFILVGALVVYGSDAGGSFIDMRGAVTVMLTAFALLCAVAQFIGWFAFKLKYENQDDSIPEDCPMAQNKTE